MGVKHAILFAIAATVYCPPAILEKLEILVHAFLRHISPHNDCVKRWEHARACLHPVTREEDNRQFREDALRRLATDVSKSSLHCSSVLASYQEEMEALVWWCIGDCCSDDEPEMACYWYEQAWERLRGDDKLQEALREFYVESAYRYYYEKCYDEGIELLCHALRIGITSSDIYYILGDMFYAQQNYNQAVLNYQSAIHCERDHYYAFVNLGNAESFRGKHERAIAEYDKVLKSFFDKSMLYVLHYNRGNAYARMRDYERALQDYNHALTLRSDFALAYGNRGNVYALLGNGPKALTDYNKARELLPNEINVVWMAVWANLDREKCIDEQAAKQLTEVAALHSEHYLAHVCRGVVLGFQDGKSEEALAEIQQALLQREDSWDSYFWYGMLRAYQEDFANAHESIKKSLELGLPPPLLQPLYWFEETHPEPFASYIQPLLTTLN
jgi:tetratricopeptide (TPR) repeat protein